MTPEQHLTEDIRDMLEGLLWQRITRHIPDDDRIGILSGSYWVDHMPSDQTYADVDHELPVFRRELGDGDSLEIMLGLTGGVYVGTRRANIISAGTWTAGVFEQHVEMDGPPNARQH